MPEKSLSPLSFRKRLGKLATAALLAATFLQNDHEPDEFRIDTLRAKVVSSLRANLNFGDKEDDCWSYRAKVRGESDSSAEAEKIQKLIPVDQKNELAINYGPDEKKKNYFFLGKEKIKVQGIFYLQNGRCLTLHSYAVEKALVPSLSTEEYWEKVKAVTLDWAGLKQAEELLELNDPEKTPAGLLKLMRAHFLQKFKISERLVAFEQKYKIKLDTELDWWGLKLPKSWLKKGAMIFMEARFTTLKRIPITEIPNYIEACEQALAKYPPDMREQLGLKTIHFLEVKNSGYSGFAPPFLAHIFIYRQEKNAIESTIHHELDHRLRWDYYSRKEVRDWGKLLYGTHHSLLYGKKSDLVNKENRLVNESFLSNYARKNPNEDQAVMSEYMFNHALSRLLARKMRKNPILRAKYDLKVLFYQSLSPLLDHDHFRQIRRGVKKFDREYWRKKYLERVYLSKKNTVGE